MSFLKINKRVVYTMIVTMIVVFSSTYAILTTLEMLDYRNYLKADYSKNLYNLISNLENIEDSLSKASVTNSNEQSILIFGDVFRYSSSANDELNSLPVSIGLTEDITAFLSKVGDYCYVLVKASADGRELSEEEYSTLFALEEQSYTLKEELNKVANDINAGDIQWGEMRKKITGIIDSNRNDMVAAKFTDIQKQINQYPALIYDGPFSDNILEIQPRINSMPFVDEAGARVIVENIYGKGNINTMELLDDTAQSKVDSYSFNIILNSRNDDENIVCDISKHGGKLVYILDNKKVLTPTLDEKAAIEKSNEFLVKMGYNNMLPTYNLKYEDNMVINYVHKVNDVSIYPEQIKIKIALDDGSIIGVESEKYLIAYTDNRVLSQPKISIEAAREILSNRAQVKSEGVAIIPSETNKEILCYEFSLICNDEEFVVYVNGDSGKVQRILKIINTPEGKLTI